MTGEEIEDAVAAIADEQFEVAFLRLFKQIGRAHV